MTVSLSFGDVATLSTVVFGVVGLYWRMQANARREASHQTSIEVRLTAIETKLQISSEDHDDLVIVKEQVKTNRKDINNQYSRIRTLESSKH